MLFQQIQVLQKERAEGAVFHGALVSSGAREFDVADAEVLFEGVHQVVHHIVGE